MEDDELEAMRAHFPLSFGKSSNAPPKPTEAIHSATRRTDAGVSSSDSGFPSLSSSSKSWLQSVRGPKRNPKSNPAPPPDDDVSLPPSQEKEEEDDDGVMVGPPPPPPPKGSDDEDDMIGPPPPPPPHVDSDEDEDDVDDDEEENRYKIPLSNEIQLKGHTKV